MVNIWAAAAPVVLKCVVQHQIQGMIKWKKLEIEGAESLKKVGKKKRKKSMN